MSETATIETPRRCKDCRRIVTDSTVAQCPGCGSEKLVVVIGSSVSLRQPAPFLHPAILAFSVTIIGALMVLRIVLTFYKGQQLTATIVYSEMLWQLQTVTLAATSLHLMLRRSEGDFRALFIVSLAIFLVAEGLAGLSRSYGITTLARLLIPINLTLFTYSGLAITAAVADGYLGDHFRRALLAANGGFLTLSVFRAVIETKSAVPNEYATIPATVVLALVTISVAWLLIRRRSALEAGDDRRLR